jgi:arylsulfatase A-like enzyme
MGRTRATALLAISTASIAGIWLGSGGCERGGDARLDGAVLVVLDTLRADGLSAYGNPRPTSPRIDALARRSVLFERVVSASSWTLPGFAGLLSGRYPTARVLDGRLLSSLVERLREAGFRTAAFTEGGYVSSFFGFDRGFEAFSEQEGPVELKVGALRLNDRGSGIEGTFRSAEEWIRTNRDAPFFLMLHSYEVHTPYRRREYAEALDRGGLPETFETEDADRFATGIVPVDQAELAYLRALYDGGVGAADREVGRLLDVLEALGLSQRTLVVLTSDHGEDLGDRPPLRPGNHGHSLYDELLLVPLIVHDPRPGAPVGRVAYQVRSIDVMPTILDLLGVPAPKELDGRSLVALMRGEESGDRPAYARIQRAGVREMVRDGSHKLIRNAFPIVPAIELYDLAGDPGESRSLGELRPERLAQLEVLLGELRSFVAEDGPWRYASPEAVPADMRKRLRALGYAQ